jgi:hypothetical protein
VLKGDAYNYPFILYARHPVEHVPLDWGPSVLMPQKGKFPRLARGWAYQERLLSARVLNFGPQELFWECREEIFCECGGISRSHEEHRVRYKVPPKIAHKKAVNAASDRERLHARWRTMVSQYAERKLTVGTDRLPAFAGVAKEMQGYLGQKYFAGLLEDSFVFDLLWTRNWTIGIEGRIRKRGAASWPGTPP